MRKSKIYIGIGLVVIAVSAFILRGSGKKKYTVFTTAVTINNSANIVCSNCFTTIPNPHQVYLRCGSGPLITVFTKPARQKRVFYKALVLAR